MDRRNESQRILYVDLTTRVTRSEPISPKFREQYIGGWGGSFKLACDLLKPHTDPFSPENPLIFGVGPLVGTSAPGSAKFGVTTKFALPATADGRNYVATAMSGSLRFSVMLRRTGFDHVVITGRASEPVYLSILDDGAEICNADHLWGKKDIYETADAFTAQYGNCGTVAIGRAGENRCRFAMAITDKQNTLGRSGVGAVMGSKNLKAVMCQSTRKIAVADPTRHQKLVEHVRRQYRENLKPLGDIPTVVWKAIVTENLNPGVWSKQDWDGHYGPKNWGGRQEVARLQLLRHRLSGFNDDPRRRACWSVLADRYAPLDSGGWPKARTDGSGGRRKAHGEDEQGGNLRRHGKQPYRLGDAPV